MRDDVTPPGAIAVQPGETVSVDGHTLRNIGPTVLYVSLAQSYGAPATPKPRRTYEDGLREAARLAREWRAVTAHQVPPFDLFERLESLGADSTAPDVKIAHMTFTEALEAMRRGARCERPGADHELGFEDGFLEQWGGDDRGDGRTLRITLEDVLATDWRVVE